MEETAGYEVDQELEPPAAESLSEKATSEEARV
jgi:hypothetical protein